ncbi:MAG: hypothetical protein EOP49_12405 [Sphingobacteriales bacterium]|nr:MAG: hypothetical protein EOP49_12405 [Sphingobacteriales bacterium]
MKRIFTLLTGFVLLSFSLKAQQSLGVRFSPDGIGGIVQAPVKGNLVFEAQLNAGGLLSQGKSFTVVGLLKNIVPLPDPRWRFYFGGGVHAGVIDPGYSFDGEQLILSEGNTKTMVGLDGIAGIEYRINSTPFSVSADYKPALNILPDIDLHTHNNFGVTVRYYLY